MGLYTHSSDVPALLATAEQIREAARQFNANYRAEAEKYRAEFPDLPRDFREDVDAQIAAGTPVVEVRGDTGVKDARRCRVTVTAGIIATDGGFIYAHDPHVLVFRSFDGRLAPQEQGARLLRKHLAAVQVPVCKVRVGC